jgi:hypothetical protein
MFQEKRGDIDEKNSLSNSILSDKAWIKHIQETG